MANLDAPFGLRPVKMADGSEYVGGGRPYYIPSSYATAVYIGSAVVRTGTANTAAVTTTGAVGGAVTFDIGTLPEVNVVTAGDNNPITGVVVRVGYDASDDARAPYGKASTQRVVWVEDNPNVLFEIQADGAVAATAVGLNAVLIDTHAGSTVTGLAGTELDTTSDVPAADASNQLRIVAISRDPMRNDTTAANTCVYVKINRHTEAADQVLGI